LNCLNYGEIHRRSLNDYIHSIKGNIRVYCRVKPTSEQSIIKYPELSLNLAQNEIFNLEIKNTKTNENTNFNFDRVFTETSTQEEIFSEVKPFIQSALDGENVCIFAYGSTGSGKTFTMQGSYNLTNSTEILNSGSGILPRCADFIFEEASRLNILGQTFKIYFSAIEIYNENLYDLLPGQPLQNKKQNRQPLTVFMANNDIQIKNLTWATINLKEDILKYTKEASDTRRSDSTQFNSCSSRSHAIFQIKIENQKDNNIITSMINIIDLAGSERSSIQSFNGKTKEEIELVKKIQNEANFINKSLTTLGRIISMIGDKKLNTGKLAIPYRESKLTMVLQNSLKPNSKTVMIVTICSDSNNYNLSKESLKFATNAMLSC
jgi:kinesin family protein C1